ncbi:MAG: FAD-dependent oxidoreductase, partial [Ruminococcus sp.]
KHRTLGVKGEEELIGSGISFCAVCDGAFYKDKEVAVIGGGNSALVEATLLAETCRKVTVVQNLDRLTGEQKVADALLSRENVEVIYSTVAEEFISENGELKKVILRSENGASTRELTVDGVFVAIGLEPDTAPFKDITTLDSYGYIVSGEDCLTDTEGVFVAGDCRKKQIRQITTATADGAVAALTACKYLDR